MEELASRTVVTIAVFKKLLAWDCLEVERDKNFCSEFMLTMSKRAFASIAADETQLIALAQLNDKKELVNNEFSSLEQ